MTSILALYTFAEQKHTASFPNCQAEKMTTIHAIAHVAMDGMNTTIVS